MALQPDGKIIAVGVASTGTFKGGYNKQDTAVVRYNTNGSLDKTFSGDGQTITSFGPNIESTATDVAVQYDGKLVVAGHTGFGSGDFAVVRYNTDGSLDTKFGGKGLGMVTTSFSKAHEDYASAVALQVDHKIVLAGYTRTENPITVDLALVRYNLNGSLDTTFSGDGKVTTHFSSGGGATAMALSPLTGKILVFTGGIVARYNTDGSPDTSFGNFVVGTPGYVTLTLAFSGRPGAMAIQANDDIVVVGASSVAGGDKDIFLARLHADGSMDTTFGTAGIVQTSWPLVVGSSVAIQPDGKIVVGWSQYFYHDGTQDKFAVARFNTNGSLDNGSAYDSTPADSFGVSGIATSTGVIVPSFGGMAIQTDGKIVMGGRAGLYATDFTLARFLGDPPLALQAASVSERAVGQMLSRDQVEPLLTEAFARWQTAGVDVSSLHGIDIRIADLGGATLGLASGHTIWLDDNAAGWGWFVDATPWEDSEFTTPGNQGEMNRIDLLTVLEHELGHVLGFDHQATGVMEDTLAIGTRKTPSGQWSLQDSALLDLVFAGAADPLRRKFI